MGTTPCFASAGAGGWLDVRKHGPELPAGDGRQGVVAAAQVLAIHEDVRDRALTCSTSGWARRGKEGEGGEGVPVIASSSSWIADPLAST